MSAKKPRCALFLADLHCGSTVAILPPGVVTHEGNELALNPLQEWYWKCWQDMTARWLTGIVGDEPFVLVLNGDLVEGNHHNTKQIVSPDEKDHYAAAFDLLLPLVRRAHSTLIVEGTECHTRNGEHSLGRDLASALRQEKSPARVVKCPDRDRWAWERADFTLAGARVVAQHHISTSVRPWTEATGLGIALNAERLEAAKAGEPLPRVLSSAHRHRYGHYEDESGLSLCSHAWQALTRHGRKVVPSARVTCGAHLIDFRGRPDGSKPELHDITYRTDRVKGVAL